MVAQALRATSSCTYKVLLVHELHPYLSFSCNKAQQRRPFRKAPLTYLPISYLYNQTTNRFAGVTPFSPLCSYSSLFSFRHETDASADPPEVSPTTPASEREIGRSWSWSMIDCCTLRCCSICAIMSATRACTTEEFEVNPPPPNAPRPAPTSPPL